MAPKKPLFDKPPPPPPPEPEEVESSSAEEGSEEEGSEEEESSEVEEEKNKPKSTAEIQQPRSQVNKNSNARKLTTPPPQGPSDSGEEEEEEEEEEAEEEAPHSPSASDFTIKAISPTKPSSKDSNPISKRPSEASKDDQKDSRSKKKVKLNADELKKDKPSASGGGGRVWSDEDIIGLLQTMIDFRNEKGVDHSADMVAFYDFVKGKLQVEFSKTQIYEKIRRLRNKFFSYMEKSERDGDDPVFSKPLESQAFDLSKRIWGGRHGDGTMVTHENVNGKGSNDDDGKAKKSGKVSSFVDTAKEDTNKDKNKKDVAEEVVRVDGKGDFESKYPFLSQSFDDIFLKENISLKENMSLIGDAKAKELEGRWKKLRQAETEVLLERLDIRKECVKLVLEVMKEK